MRGHGYVSAIEIGLLLEPEPVDIPTGCGRLILVHRLQALPVCRQLRDQRIDYVDLIGRLNVRVRRRRGLFCGHRSVSTPQAVSAKLAAANSAAAVRLRDILL
jgi:hypothetical protein